MTAAEELARFHDPRLRARVAWEADHSGITPGPGRAYLVALLRWRLDERHGVPVPARTISATVSLEIVARADAIVERIRVERARVARRPSDDARDQIREWESA